ncbi:MAG TPA: SDR family oxidoreductase [Verrucomicrobiae bacterium]
MDLKLKNKVALVTGGARGIGEAIVRLLVMEGARVAIVDRNRESGEALAAQLQGAGANVLFVSADLTVEADCLKAVEQTVKTFGQLDIVVNNAGVNDGVSLEQAPAEFMQSLQLNLFHVYAITHHARVALRASKGVVINISSKVAVTGQGKTSGYAAAKGAVNALTREWAIAFAPDGVRVNCVVPAECLTPQYENWFNSLPDPAATKASVERLVPLGKRMTVPEEIAVAVVFLASPVSAHTTGQIHFVDGGYTHLDRAITGEHAKWG